MRFPLSLLITLACLVWTASSSAQNFDKLNDADRTAMASRFDKEIWPLLTRGGKESCVGCHGGKIVSDLRLSGDTKRDFTHLLQKGFFLKDDPGSLLERITDPDPKRRMPPGKRERWSDADVATLRSFVQDLDSKQKK